MISSTNNDIYQVKRSTLSQFHIDLHYFIIIGFGLKVCQPYFIKNLQSFNHVTIK